MRHYARLINREKFNLLFVFLPRFDVTGSKVDRRTSGLLEIKMATNRGKLSINCRQNTGREDTSKFNLKNMSLLKSGRLFCSTSLKIDKILAAEAISTLNELMKS